MRSGKVAHAAAEPGPEDEPPGVKIVQVGPDHREEAQQMGFGAGRVAVEFDLGDLGLDKAAECA